jgi:hypothetical protein
VQASDGRQQGRKAISSAAITVSPPRRAPRPCSAVLPTVRSSWVGTVSAAARTVARGAWGKNSVAKATEPTAQSRHPIVAPTAAIAISVGHSRSSPLRRGARK